MEEIPLGEMVKHTPTGFVGMAVARCTYLTAQPRIAVRALVKSGKLEPEEWFEQAELERQPDVG